MAIKTITCPACGAEQAIFRGEDDTMQCAFCGETIALPDYDQTEEMDYSYEEPAKETSPKVQPVGEKIDAVFVLSEEEVGNAFEVSGKIQERRWILYAETAVFSVVGIITLVMNVLNLMGKTASAKTPGFSEWLMVAICFIMIPVIWTMPKRTKQKIIRKSTSGNQLELGIYENLIHVHINGRDEADDWQQPFDGSYGVINQKDLFVLTLQNGQILAIPHRSLTEEQIPVVEQRLLSKPEETAAEN